MTKLRYGVLAVVIALGAGCVWAWSDYRAWLALGPGGLPYNLRGWATATWMRTMTIDPVDTSHFAVGSPLDHVFLGQLPKREGSRPLIGAHPVPHRQLSQLPGPEMRRKIAATFDAAVERHSEAVGFRLSFFEKRNPAVTLHDWQGGGSAVQSVHGEIAHIHPFDGSMHMIFSPSDAKTVIQSGWGECHPLAGKLGLPDTYLLVYPPRDDRELAVTAELLDAAIGLDTRGRSSGR